MLYSDYKWWVAQNSGILIFRELVAQLVEHLTFNQRVPGSNPGELATYSDLFNAVLRSFIVTQRFFSSFVCDLLNISMAIIPPVVIKKSARLNTAKAYWSR